MEKIMVINGPNLNLLGIRDKGVYGELSLGEINRKLEKHGARLGYAIEFFQSNIEGEIVNALQNARDCVGVIINPGGYSHTSVAIRDAIEAIGVPVIEVHISNIYKREEFRRQSVTATACLGQIAGLGWCGYSLALDFFCVGQG